MSTRALRAAWFAALFAAAACGGGGSGGSPPAATATPGDDAAGGGPGGGPAGGGGGTPAGSICLPASCAALGKTCGTLDDGCGGKTFCGTCAAGQVCGAGGANVCGAPPAGCAPTSCAAAGATCGAIADGCGGTLSCGGCTGGATCGGGGTANVCGSPPVKGGETRWVEYVAGGGEEGVWGVKADGAGELVTVVVKDGYDRRSISIRKLAADRSVEWEKVIAGSGGGVQPLKLAVSPAGSVFLAFYFSCYVEGCRPPDLGAGPAFYAVVKLSASGAFEWQKASEYWSSGALAVDANGNSAVPVFAPAGGNSFAVYDPAGAERFSVALPTPVAQLAFAPDGSLHAAWYDLATGNYTIGKYDTAGNRLWTAESRAWIAGLATSARGTLVALGYDDLAVYEAADGALRFRRSIPIYARDIDVQPGLHDVIRVAIVGQQAGGGCGELTVRTYDLAGTFRWSRSIGAKDSCGGSPQAYGVAVLDGGDVVVGGSVSVPTDLGVGERDPEDISDGFLMSLAP